VKCQKKDSSGNSKEEEDEDVDIEDGNNGEENNAKICIVNSNISQKRRYC